MNFRQHQRAEVSVNLTPLIDVVFLLLIFFMVSTSFTKETQLRVDLPEATGVQPENMPNRLEVVVNSEGNYAINGRDLIDSESQTLRRALLELAGDDRTMPFLITADATTEHQAVVTVMDIAGQLGFSRLSIATQRPVKAP
jgi:biopolymer transport protein ExbD